MNVTLPNGRVIEGVPEGTTKEQIAEKAVNSGIASWEDFGMTLVQDNLQQQPVQPQEQLEPSILDSFADFFSGESRTTPEIEALGEIGNAPELNEMSWSAFKTSLGLLATGDQEKAKSVIKSNIPEAEFTQDQKGNTIVNLPSGQYALNKPGISPQDIAKGVFDIAAFTPAGRVASVPTAAAASGATELALQEAARQTGAGDIDLSDVATSSALGGAFKGAEDLIGAGYRAIKGKTPQTQREIIEAGQESGVTVMTSDLIEPKTLSGQLARSTGEKIPFAGTGQVRASQQEMREEAVSKFVDKFQSPSYSDIIDSIQKKSKGVKSSAGNILNQTGKKLDEAGDIPVDKTREAIDSALEELSKPNIRVDQSAIDELQDLKSLMDMPQTFTSLKQNRTVFRDVLDSFGKGERSQLPTRSKSLINKAIGGMTSDMESFAKSNLSPKEFNSWKKANSVYAEEAQKLKKSRIKNILDKGDVTPENVGTMLFSQKPSEVKSLYNSLTTEGKKNARSALIYRAVDNASKRAGGLTPNAFSSELNKISKNTDVFFRGADRKQLEGFKRLMEATRRAQDAAVETPTGQQLLGAGAGYAAFTDLGATLGLGGTAGGLSRLYESAPVRNALLKLGSVPKGSDQYLKALFEAQSALSSGAQALRRESEEK